jgi:tetratricopeptide (TPR) repeat protein
MKRLFIFIFFILAGLSAVSPSYAGNIGQDTAQVIKLNKLGLKNRMTSPEQTINYSSKALALAKKANYTAGIGESYRVLGIGYYYSNQLIKAMDNYVAALNIFTQLNDLRGEAKVYNNIGSLYRDNDYDLSLEYLQKSLVIAKKINDKSVIAGLYLNMGSAYYRKNSLYQALNFYNQSAAMYAVLKDSVNLVQCLQNRGVIYFNLKQFDVAEQLLVEAHKEAKQMDLNVTVASIDLTLASLYIQKNDFANAEKTVQEGVIFSQIVKDDKLESDFKYTTYQLELKRKNYRAALAYLQEIASNDSATYKQNSSTQIKLVLEQTRQEARQRENELLLQRQSYDRVKFWAVAVMACLLLFVVGLLISNVKRKAKTNQQLNDLKAEVSRQKDNLDRINHHLEEIIDERTKDLQVKNKKLSEYSSYLSHQIRGPIATLKGLLNLEKEGLVDKHECIKMMNKCVGEIDDKIIEMSDMLHDPGRPGF